MLSASKQKVAANNSEVMVHCQRCHDVFTLGVVLDDRKILRYDPNPHIVESNHSRYKKLRCRCGGELDFFHW